MGDWNGKKNNDPVMLYDENSLAQGYKEMSRINLGLAEDSLASDNEALEICEQKFAECE